MKISQALKQIEGTTKKISSKESASYAQDFASIIHWLFLCSPPSERKKNYKRFRAAKDWEVDKE